MEPGGYDLKLYRGDTYSWSFVLWADDAASVPVDLTGVVVAAEIRDKPAGPVVVPLEVAVDPPGGNTIIVGLGTTEWGVGVPAAGAWDLQLTYASGVVRTVVAGKVTVTTDVTESTPTTATLDAERRARAPR